MSCVINFDPSQFSGDGTPESPLQVDLSQATDNDTTNETLSFNSNNGILRLTDSEGGSLAVTLNVGGTTNQTLTFDPDTNVLSLTDSDGDSVGTVIPTSSSNTTSVALNFDEASGILTLMDSDGQSLEATITGTGGGGATTETPSSFLKHSWSTLGQPVDEGSIGPQEPLHVEYRGMLDYIEIDVRHTENVLPPSATFDVDPHDGGILTIWAIRGGARANLGTATLPANSGHVVAQVDRPLLPGDSLVPTLSDTGTLPLVGPRFRIGYTQEI